MVLEQYIVEYFDQHTAQSCIKVYSPTPEYPAIGERVQFSNQSVLMNAKVVGVLWSFVVTTSTTVKITVYVDSSC